MQQKTNVWGVISLNFAILSIMFSVISCLGLLFAVLAFIFGIIGATKKQMYTDFAISGIIWSIVGATFSIIMLFFQGVLVNMIQSLG